MDVLYLLKHFFIVENFNLLSILILISTTVIVFHVQFLNFRLLILNRFLEWELPSQRILTTLRFFTNIINFLPPNRALTCTLLSVCESMPIIVGEGGECVLYIFGNYLKLGLNSVSFITNSFLYLFEKNETYCLLYHCFLIIPNYTSKFYSLLAHVLSMPALKTNVLHLFISLICSFNSFIHINQQMLSLPTPHLLLGPVLICFC